MLKKHNILLALVLVGGLTFVGLRGFVWVENCISG